MSSELTLSRPSRQSRTAIAVSMAALAVLTVLGTAPSRTIDAVDSSGGFLTPAVGEQGPGEPGADRTFAELFDEMRAPETSRIGEGQNMVVSVAAPASSVAGPPVSGEIASGPALPPADVPATVVPVRPVLTVRGVEAAAAADVAAVPGVAAAAAAAVGRLVLDVPDGPLELSVAVVDPTAFRPLTPEITANEPGVWQRLIAGDAVFTHDAGGRVGVPLGTGVFPLGATSQVRIGAYASNGIPSVADVLISQDTATRLGLSTDTTIYVALDEGASVASVRDAVAGTWSAGVVELIDEPEEQQAFLTGSATAQFFEPFSYLDHGDGLITIDPAWVARNIATKRLPIFTGNVTCHRQMLVQLEGALAEVEAAGLAPLIDTTDYGGCWVARHIDWRPDRPISMHGWGLAVDFNVRTNGLGAQPTMDPRIVAIFDRWGFVWGGRWSRPDGMHFELGAVLQPESGQLSQMGQ